MDFDRNAAFQSPEQEAGPGYGGHGQPVAGYSGPGQPGPGYAGPGQPVPGYPVYADPQAHVPQTPLRTTFGRCVQASLVWVGAVLIVQFGVIGAPLTGRALGYLLGSMLVPLLGGAWLTWLFFRRRQPAFWLLVLGSLPAFFISFVLFGAMRLAGRT